MERIRNSLTLESSQFLPLIHRRLKNNTVNNIFNKKTEQNINILITRPLAQAV